jgi:formylglycine-generating enzyme required for sulfatase activity
VKPLPPIEALEAQLLPCSGGEVLLPAANGGPGRTQTVPPFRILPRCVTWAELASALTRPRCDGLMADYAALVPAAAGGPALQPDAPAIVSCSAAQEYAAAAGARLPGALELRAALGLPGLHLGDDARLQSEWTGTPAEPAARSRHVFLYSGLAAGTPWTRWTEPAAVSGLRLGNGFRVVLSGKP